MSSNVAIEVASNQLRQDLSQIVDNFTLLDILSKEEQEIVLETKIDNIKRKNEERMRRHQEIEVDKLQASRDGSTVSSPSSLTIQTPPPDQAMSSPVQPSASPSIDSGHVSPASPIERGREDGGGGGDLGRPGGKDVAEAERGFGSGRSKQRPDDLLKDPSSVKTHTEILEIDLHTVGTGLGFGVMNFPGVGVTVKTILPEGVAGKDGRLHSGDLLLQINDINVEKKTLNDVYDILKQCQGDVRLVLSREILQVSRGPPANQRRDNQRRGPGKDTSRPKKEALMVIFQNDRLEQEQKVKRKVVMRGESKEDLVICVDVENDQGRPLGSGGSGRGRGRTVRVSREEVKRKEFEEKRKENLDRVEAEIAAMRVALENEKAAGAINPPSKSVYSFLDDPLRYGVEPQRQHPTRGYRHEGGGRRNQRSRGGPDADSAAGGAGRRRDQRGRGSSYRGRRSPNADTETTVTMTGKERQEYEEWKREREKIDQERLRRHQQATMQQVTGWGNQAKQEEEDWDADGKTPEFQAGQGEMRIGHWDASNPETEKRVERTGGGASHFEHDDRVGSQTGSRIGSGRFPQDGSQHGRGGGRGFHRGGRGQDPGWRGRGGADRGGSRPGRRVSDRELSCTDIRTLPDCRDARPKQAAEKSFQDSPIGQWQQSESDVHTREVPNPAKVGENVSTNEVTDATESLRIGPLPSPSAGSGCKSPLSPLSPFTPTGHTFLTDWAAETEARGGQEFAFEGDLVYNNSGTGRGS